MFRFFRHHTWILVATLSLTILSFVFFMAKGSFRSGSDSNSGNYGTLYGHVISPMEYEKAKSSFFIIHWLQTGEWPDKNSAMTANEIEQEIYSYLIMNIKAREMGIHVSDDEAAAAAGEMLRAPSLMRMFGTSEPVPAQAFIQQVLEPEHLGAADLEEAARTRLINNQLVTILGLPGTFVTPQEAGALYDHAYQEISAQAVFFSASNYISPTLPSLAETGLFYTNHMAAYREPDRVQVDYLVFSASNYMAQSKAEWAKTNFEETVNSVYDRFATTEFASEKSPDAAKAKIRDILYKRRALQDANTDANKFIATLYSMSPVQEQNLANLALQKHLTLLTSAPFGEDYGPQDFDAPASLAKAAFQLNADSPYTGPIVGNDAVYIIGLAHQWPSMIPSFDSIRPQVTRDYLQEQAVTTARQAGTNFYYTARVQVSFGHKFSAAADASHLQVVNLSPFSLSSSGIPELGNQESLDQIKRAAFTTAPGNVSPFVPSSDGGFILYVQSLLPVDQNQKSADMPKFLAQVRQSRLNEAFNLWIISQLNQQLPNTPLFAKLQQGDGR